MSNDNILLPSNKKFGIVMGFVAISFGGFVVFHQIRLIGYVLLLVGFLLIFGALKNSEWLSPLNRAWMRFGELLGKVVSPILLSLIFFSIFFPVSLFFKLIGRDELKLRRVPLTSYWVEKKERAHAPKSFRRQF
ncbi:MAG: hypothetical protein ACO3I1_10040 [Burkholderiales bacterium]